MCCYIVTHTTRCDVRPLVSDGHRMYVDPFAEPSQCFCEPDASIMPWFRCEDHGCCMKTGKVVRCPNQCAQQLVVHRYVQARPRQEHLAMGGSTHGCKGFWDPEDYGGTNVKNKSKSTPDEREHRPWVAMEAIDEVIFANYDTVPSIEPEIITALNNVVNLGRMILNNQLSLALLSQEWDIRTQLYVMQRLTNSASRSGRKKQPPRPGSEQTVKGLVDDFLEAQRQLMKEFQLTRSFLRQTVVFRAHKMMAVDWKEMLIEQLDIGQFEDSA